MKMLNSVHRFRSAEDGETAVEYAVFLVMILVMIAFGVTSTGGGFSAKWSAIKSDMEPNNPEHALVLPAATNPPTSTSTEPIRHIVLRYQGWSRPSFK